MTEHTNHPNDRVDPPTGDDYLWDRTGEPDPLTAQLEQSLAPLRYRPQTPPSLTRRTARQLPRLWPAVAAAVILLASVIGIYRVTLGPEASGWRVAAVRGAPRVGQRTITSAGILPVGGWLETTGQDTADVAVADIGSVTVHPNSRLQLVRSMAQQEHRLRLDRGRIDATILAPPRLFFVDTPSAVAIDLGCAYTLAVDDAGNGRLEVTLGWVGLERDGREVTVPRDAVCELRAGIGPGTPHFDDAAEALREALASLDFDEVVVEGALDRVLDSARPRDTLTLWHLLHRADAPDRARIADRIAALAQLPEGVSVELMIRLDDRALDTLWDHLNYDHW